MASGSTNPPATNGEQGNSAEKKKPQKMQNIWHTSCPYQSGDWDVSDYGLVPKSRVKLDIANLFHSPLPGIVLCPSEKDITKMHALIIGNYDTPYEGGFFHFYIRVGPNYPFSPPRVSSMTSYRFGDKVRFNPNLYCNGKVCLSILGTWSGPAWSAANNIGSLLLSIQSLLSGKALRNEPGYDNLKDNDPRVVKYDLFVRHETIRVAVLLVLSKRANSELPYQLVSCMAEQFLENYPEYLAKCDENAHHDGKSVATCLGGDFTPQFKQLKVKLAALYEELSKEYPEVIRKIKKRERESQSSSGSTPSSDSSSAQSLPSTSGKGAKAKKGAVTENKKLPKVCQKPTATGDAMMREYNFTMREDALDADDNKEFVINHEDSDAELSPYEEDEDE